MPTLKKPIKKENFETEIKKALQFPAQVNKSSLRGGVWFFFKT